MDIKTRSANRSNIARRLEEASAAVARNERTHSATSLQRRLANDISDIVRPVVRAVEQGAQEVERVAAPVIENFIQSQQSAELAYQMSEDTYLQEEVWDEVSTNQEINSEDSGSESYADAPMGDENNSQQDFYQSTEVDQEQMYAQESGTEHLSPNQYSAEQILEYEEKPGIGSKIFTALSIILLVTGLFASVMGFVVKNRVGARISQLQQVVEPESSGSKTVAYSPAEIKPTIDEINAYTVNDPAQPKYLSLENQDFKLMIDGVGASESGDVGFPGSIYDAGWYMDSAKPTSSKGAILLTGYTEGPSSGGAFSGFENLQPGDVMSIEQGDGTVSSYEMKGRQVYAPNEVDLAKALTSYDSAKLGLNILISSGAFNSQSGYSQYILIQATKLN